MIVNFYKKTGGRPLEEFLAHRKGVQAELQATATEGAAKAEAKLAAHRKQGHAKIEIEHGRIDYHVILSDIAGDWAAGAIEFGRDAYTYKKVDPVTGDTIEIEVPAAEGLWVLHDAFGLPHRPPRGLKPEGID